MASRVHGSKASATIAAGMLLLSAHLLDYAKHITRLGKRCLMCQAHNSLEVCTRWHTRKEGLQPSSLLKLQNNWWLQDQRPNKTMKAFAIGAAFLT